jgi:hypothetical protein
LRRVSPKQGEVQSAWAARRSYSPTRDYGTRGYERDKKIVPFGDVRATIYKRSDIAGSSWFLRVHLREEKRHYRKSLQTTDRQEAYRRARSEVIKLLSRVESGQRILSPLIREVARDFYKHQEAAGELAPKTLVLQRYRVELGLEFLRSVLPAGDQTPISAVEGSLFDRYPQWRQAKAASKSSTIRRDVIRDELLVIRKMFKFAKDRRLCSERNIPQWSLTVEKESPKRRRMTQKNYTDFINCIRAWRHKAKNDKDRYYRDVLHHFVLVVANTGFRSGELFNLKNRDVEVRKQANECIVTIRPETSKVRKGRQIAVLASHGGPKPINYLLRWITEHQRHKDPNDFVFAVFDNGRQTVRDIYYHYYKTLRRELKAIELDWFDTYHCRHFWITNRLLAEEPIHVVAKVAGTSTAQIEDTYSHVLTEMAARQFGKKRVIYSRDGSWTVDRLRD